MGCPNDCVFCNQVKISGYNGPFDYNEIIRTFEECYSTIENNNEVEIAFFGGSFTALDFDIQENLLKLADDFRKKINNRSCIKISTRPDKIDERILNLLKKYDVKTIELGVQSMDDEVLIKSLRGHLSDIVYRSSELIKSYNFELGIQIMIGLPFDTEKKLKETIDKVIAIKPDIARLYPVLVIKDTELEKMYLRNEYISLDVKQAVELTKKAYIALEENNIKVIRIGLQNTKNIEKDSDVVAGPFHPAFGELVKSSVIRDRIEDYIKKNSPSEIYIKILPSKVSQVSGNKKVNKEYFKEKYNIKLNIIKDKNLQEDIIVINDDEIQIFNRRECY